MADSGVPFALATYESNDAGPRLGLVVDGGLADLIDAVATVAGAPSAGAIPTDMRSLIEGWPDVEAGVARAAAGLAGGVVAVRPLASIRLRAPIRDPWNLLAIAANYRAHADEMGHGSQVDPDAEEPVFFAKSPRNCIADPGQAFVIPPGRNIDWEGELALVIGRDAQDVSLETAADHIFGYTVGFDVSDRGGAGRPTNALFPGPYWFRGKSRDGAAPLGPVIVPKAFVPDPGALRIVTRVNGEIRQDGSTARLIYDEAHIVRSLSAVMTLRAGDVVLTGTPDGVGVARTPPVFLAPGDLVSITIDGIGTLETPMVGALRIAANHRHRGYQQARNVDSVDRRAHNPECDPPARPEARWPAPRTSPTPRNTTPRTSSASPVSRRIRIPRRGGCSRMGRSCRRR